jgi:hypothetical protein
MKIIENALPQIINRDYSHSLPSPFVHAEWRRAGRPTPLRRSEIGK